MSAQHLSVVEGAGHRGAWAELWERDRWRQSELPNGDLSSTYRGDRIVNFARLQQPWLKEAAQRWARARALAGTSISSISAYVGDLAAFSDWLAAARPEVVAPAVISREVVEDYMLWVRTETLKAATRARYIGSLRMLLDEQREDGLAGLPKAAVIHGAEIPRPDYHVPKALGDDVFSQLVAPPNLALLRHEHHRTVVLLLAYTGFRVSSIVTLTRGALSTGPDGQPYLRYFNIKMKREAMLPIPEVLEQQLRTHEQWLAESRMAESRYLLPTRRMVHGDRHLSHSTIRKILKAYISLAQIRTADGNLANHAHPHLFRHHLGTTMINDGVPINVVAKVLDHNSLEMTARYAHIHDETLRTEVRRWHQRVNIRGERIALPIEGPMAEAAWMKERIARAKQALPNGYCGLPLVHTCPHPNACLSCDSFLTDASFRTIHEQQLQQTDRLLRDAQANEQMRLVDVLQRDQTSLQRILDGLEELDTHNTDLEPAIDLIGLAGGAPLGA